MVLIDYSTKIEDAAGPKNEGLHELEIFLNEMMSQKAGTIHTRFLKIEAALPGIILPEQLVLSVVLNSEDGKNLNCSGMHKRLAILAAFLMILLLSGILLHAGRKQASVCEKIELLHKTENAVTKARPELNRFLPWVLLF